MLIIAFLLARQLGSGMYEDPVRGLYSAVKTFRLTIDLNLHPL